MISASIICLNEAEKLERCLKSLKGFADEIVVVDLGSSDESQSEAESFGAVVFRHKFVPYVEMIRNLAISKTTGDWVLVLDPDEVLPTSLKDKLQEIVKEDKFEAINIPRKNIFFGRWIRHTNWWPDRHIRFFKKGRVEWRKMIHTYPKVNGRILDLQAEEKWAIVHYGYDNIREFIDRQNRYSTIEAQNLYETGERFSWAKFFWWPIREFLVRFIKHQGYLDGFYGFTLTFLMMVYKIMVLVKLWDFGRKGREG